MSEEDIKAIKRLEFILEDKRQCIGSEKNFKAIETVLKLIDKQEKEIEELKKVIKMVEIYKSHGIPEEAEMVIMRKDNFLRNTNNEFISKDTIKEIIEEHYPDVAITKLQELLEE